MSSVWKDSLVDVSVTGPEDDLAISRHLTVHVLLCWRCDWTYSAILLRPVWAMLSLFLAY